MFTRRHETKNVAIKQNATMEYLVLRGLNWKVVLAFLDDILVLGRDFEGHLANLRAVLVRFREYGLKLKPKNVNSFKRKWSSWVG